MTEPRTPPTSEAELPDALDQVPDTHQSSGPHGSEDAQLLAEAGQEESDVERETPPEDPGLTND